MQKDTYFGSPMIKKKDPLSSKRLLFLVLLGIVVAFFLRHFVIDIIQVTSSSMQPTINVGVRYLMEKISYRIGKPK
jgi:signal peptidase I